MSEAERDRPQRSAQPSQPLEYMPPRHDPERRRHERNIRTGGAVLSALSVFVVVFVFIICNIPMSAPPGTAPAAFVVQAPLLCLAIALVIVGAIGWHQWRLHRSRAFLAGALIGVGVAALIEGVCFAV